MLPTMGNMICSGPATDARSAAKKKSSVARKDAAAEKLDADYAVAKEKCDTFAGGAKDTCLDRAKANFGQP